MTIKSQCAPQVEKGLTDYVNEDNQCRYVCVYLYYASWYGSRMNSLVCWSISTLTTYVLTISLSMSIFYLETKCGSKKPTCSFLILHSLIKCLRQNKRVIIYHLEPFREKLIELWITCNVKHLIRLPSSSFPRSLCCNHPPHEGNGLWSTLQNSRNWIPPFFSCSVHVTFGNWDLPSWGLWVEGMALHACTSMKNSSHSRSMHWTPCRLVVLPSSW